MHKNVIKKMCFTLQLMIHWTLQSESAPEGTLEVTPKDTLEISFELQLWLHLVMQALIHKCVQNGSSNDGPDGVC